MGNLTPPIEGRSFMGARQGCVEDVCKGGFAVIGAPFGTPYDLRGIASGAADAPAAIRAASYRYRGFAGRYDFDIGAPLFDPGQIDLHDLGDCAGDPADPGTAVAAIETTVRAVSARGALPIVLGGDDSTPIPICAGLNGHSDVHVLQIDAHLDYRDEVQGQRYGYSSPMRRVREMPHVGKIVHVGTRGIGSAHLQDMEDTLAAGNTIVTARDVARSGTGAALSQFPDGANVYVTIDCDGLDPSVMPGTSVPLPGGLAFYDVVDMVLDLIRRCHLRGISFAEHYPEFDVNRHTAIAITRIISNAIGMSLRKQST